MVDQAIRYWHEEFTCMMKGGRGHLQLSSQIRLAAHVRNELFSQIADNHMRRATWPSSQFAQKISGALHDVYRLSLCKQASMSMPTLTVVNIAWSGK